MLQPRPLRGDFQQLVLMSLMGCNEVLQVLETANWIQVEGTAAA